MGKIYLPFKSSELYWAIEQKILTEDFKFLKIQGLIRVSQTTVT